MPSEALHHYPGTMGLSRWIIVGFLSGAVSVLIFHQGMAALLHTLELTARTPYSMEPTRPWGVPQLLSIMFWGGLWGVVFAAIAARLNGARLLLAALVFGASLPTLIAWFLVAPLKGQPVAGGFAPAAMAVAVMVNAAWGLGTGLGLALLGSPPARPTR
jgi:hypothetical protein